MWARIVEFLFALWLAISPFFFEHPRDDLFIWTNSFVCAALTSFFSLICFYFPLRKMHLCNLIVVLWLIILAFTAKQIPPPPLFQNYLVFAVLNIFLCLVPTESEFPPYPWRQFLEKQKTS